MTDPIFADPKLRSLVKRIRIQTDQFKAVIARFDQWMKGAQLGIQICALVIGDSGVGKTEIAKALCEKYPAVRKADGLTSPIVFVQTPDSPSSIGLIEAMLESLGDPQSGSGNKRAKLRRLLKMLKDQNVQAVLLDDIQQMIDPNREWLIYDASECLKTILKMSTTSFVGFGLSESTLLTKLNEQWERLNQGTIVVDRFDWNDTTSRQQFRAVLKKFQEELGMFDLPDLSSNVMALRFFLATGGLIDYVAKILLQATWDAIDDNRKTIDLGNLQLARKQAICTTEDLGYDAFGMKITPKQNFNREIAKAKTIVAHKTRQVNPRRSRKTGRLAAIGLK